MLNPLPRRIVPLAVAAAGTLALALASPAPSATAPWTVASHGMARLTVRDRVACSRPRRGRARCRRVKRARTVRALVIQTTYNLANALTDQGRQPFGAAPDPGAAVIRVDPKIRYQHIIGFGGAMTDSSAWLLYDELTRKQRKDAMRALFGPNGIRLNFVRVPIGASDFTANGIPYTYDDTPKDRPDPRLKRFSIKHDEAYIIPALRSVLRIDPKVFTVASPWTPPPWMKANHAFDNEFLTGSVLPRYYRALAWYLVRFMKAYGARKVPTDAITIMNEPRSLSPWPGSSFLPADQVRWLPRFLEPTLRAAHIHPAVYGLDATRLTDAQTLLRSRARADLAGTAFHCYHGMHALSRLHYEFPYKRIIETECSPGIAPYATPEIAIDATRNWASAVQLWNLALDPAGGPVQPPNFGCKRCTGIITVSEATHTASYGRNFYQFGQISRYVRPGAVRIFSTRLVSDSPSRPYVTPGVDDVAFQNPDGSKVLVAYNTSPTAALVAIKYHGRYLNWTIASASTVTFVWK
jgi:O-glycosyl hydrolase